MPVDSCLLEAVGLGTVGIQPVAVANVERWDNAVAAIEEAVEDGPAAAVEATDSFGPAGTHSGARGAAAVRNLVANDPVSETDLDMTGSEMSQEQGVLADDLAVMLETEQFRMDPELVRVHDNPAGEDTG